jgi:hypothetical protein
MVEAAVEAVFNEDKDAARERRLNEEPGAGNIRPGARGHGIGGVLSTVAVVFMSLIGGTALAVIATPDTGFLSPLHTLWMVGVGGMLKVAGGLWQNYS